MYVVRSTSSEWNQHFTEWHKRKCRKISLVPDVTIDCSHVCYFLVLKRAYTYVGMYQCVTVQTYWSGKVSPTHSIVPKFYISRIQWCHRDDRTLSHCSIFCSKCAPKFAEGKILQVLWEYWCLLVQTKKQRLSWSCYWLALF